MVQAPNCAADNPLKIKGLNNVNQSNGFFITSTRGKFGGY